MIKSGIYFPVALIFLLSNFADTRKQSKEKIDHVAYLNETTFPSFLVGKHHILILFVKQKCKDCKQFSPKFKKVAREAHNKNWNFSFVQIDGLSSNVIAQEYKVDHYPSLVLVNLKEEVRMNYTDEISFQGLFRFVKRIQLWNVTEVNSPSEIENTLPKRRKHILLFAGDRDAYAKQYSTVIRTYDTLSSFHLVYTKNPEFLKSLGISQFDVVLYRADKDSTSKKRILSHPVRLYLPLSLTRELFNSHYNIYRRPPVAELSDEILHMVLELNINSIIFIHDIQSLNQTNQVATELANKYRHEFWFLNVSIEDETMSHFFALMNITKESVPQLLLLSHKQNLVDDLHKFKSQGGKNISAEEVETFISQWRNNKLRRYFASEPDRKNPISEFGIHRLTANSFPRAFTNVTNDILVLYCSKPNKKCTRLENVFDIVARKLSKNPNLILAEIDPTKNELDGIEIKDVPHLVFYPSNPSATNIESRIASSVIYSGNYTFNEIISFVNSHSKNSITVQVLEKEEKYLKDEAKYPVIRPGKTDYTLNEISGLARQHLLGGNEQEEDEDDIEPEEDVIEKPKKKEKKSKRQPKEDL